MLNFLDSEYTKGIQVLHYIYNSIDPVSLEDISNHIGSSKRVISLLLKDIENDSKKLPFGLKETKDGNYYLVSKKINKAIYLNEYVLLCAKKSLVFLIAEEIFYKGKLNIVKICNRLYISQATFSRGKRKLATLLQACNLQLPIYVKDGIVGNEYKIRMFYFQFFTSFYNSIEWPFEKHAQVEIEKYFHFKIDELFTPMSKEQKRKFYFLVYIMKKRMSQGYFVEEVPVSFKPASNHDEIFKLVKKYLEDHKISNQKNIDNEIVFFIYGIYTQEMFKIDTERVSIFLKEDNLTLEISNIWIEEFKNVFKQKLTKKEEMSFKSKLTLLHYNFIYSHATSKLFSDYEMKYTTKDKFDEEILQDANQIFINLMNIPIYETYRNEKLSDVYNNDVIESYYYYIYNYILSKKKIDAIPLFISDSILKIDRDILKKKLSLIFGDKIIIEEKKNSDVKLILTNNGDHEELTDELMIYFYKDKKSFFKIISEIQKRIYLQLLDNKY